MALRCRCGGRGERVVVSQEDGLILLQLSTEVCSDFSFEHIARERQRESCSYLCDGVSEGADLPPALSSLQPQVTHFLCAQGH